MNNILKKIKNGGASLDVKQGEALKEKPEKRMMQLELDSINLGLWLNLEGFFENNNKRLISWFLYTVFVIGCQTFVTFELFLDTLNDEHEVDQALKQISKGKIDQIKEEYYEISTQLFNVLKRRKYRRQSLVMILVAITVLYMLSNIMKKQLTIIKVINDDRIRYKPVWCFMLFYQMSLKMMAIGSSQFTVNISSSYTDALGNMFGIIVLAELDTLALTIFHAYLEFLHPSIAMREDFLQIEFEESWAIATVINSIFFTLIQIFNLFLFIFFRFDWEQMPKLFLQIGKITSTNFYILPISLAIIYKVQKCLYKNKEIQKHPQPLKSKPQITIQDENDEKSEPIEILSEPSEQDELDGDQSKSHLVTHTDNSFESEQIPQQIKLQDNQNQINQSIDFNTPSNRQKVDPMALNSQQLAYINDFLKS